MNVGQCLDSRPLGYGKTVRPVGRDRFRLLNQPNLRTPPVKAAKSGVAELRLCRGRPNSAMKLKS